LCGIHRFYYKYESAQTILMTMSIAPTDLADETITTVRRWLAESATVKADPSAERLAGVLKDPKGLDFTIGFVDKVVRPEDLRVAGRNLEKLSHSIPAFLPWYLRFAITLGGGFAPLLPWLIVPIARWVLRRMVGHLVIDASPKSLDKTLAGLRTCSVKPCSAMTKPTADSRERATCSRATTSTTCRSRSRLSRANCRCGHSTTWSSAWSLG
jgi:hypothetical protein